MKMTATVSLSTMNLFGSTPAAAIAWNEMRRAWRGDRSSVSQRKPREPTMHCSSTFKEVPIDGPVPLSKMVELLVEAWEED
ncbi:uncharacterized protein LOC125202288 isoform X2 [Salvia hispanica]|uniref:uncharacterized protein LOC125202288 isoform X2 n=1 Tax=Salvia hispanica TaxID=49212 RepID=UPI0020091F3E|nr:uncharacterized protein LOC125202288 isoform X2 [Salvia hispanica]